MSTHKKSAGSAVILLAVILMAASAAAAYYWQHQKVATLSKQVNVLKAQAAAAAKSSASPPTFNLAGAAQYTNSFYAAYLKAAAVKNGPTETIQKYGTPNLAFYYKYYDYGFDPIVCAQTTPLSIKTTGHSLSSGVALVYVQETYGSGSPLVISVNIVDEGGLKVDSVTCPGTLGVEPPNPPAN